jgi:hypothetical protein
MSRIYGTSPRQGPNEAPQLIASAEFEPFAPAVNICCGCCITDTERERTYARIYENNVEVNIPFNPCCCLGMDCCTKDFIAKSYFDQPPHRAGFCCCFPCFCCGNPAIYEESCSCCCIDCNSCCGIQVMASPCDCFGLRTWILCGAPCYKCFGLPIIPSTKNTTAFISQYRRAVRVYSEKHGLPKSQMAKFYASSGCTCVGPVHQVPEGMAPPVGGATMDRGDGLPEKVKTVKAPVYDNEAESHTSAMDGGNVVEMK